MNKVVLIGNLTRDPELSQTSNGVPMCRFSIAVNRNFKNSSGEREADFFNIIAWRELGELCGRYLRKGLKVGVVGSLQTRTYEQDGIKKYATDVVADEVEFLTPKDYAPSGGGDYHSKDRGDYSSKGDAPKSKAREAAPVEDEDLPF
jgi:single-strand DNA-binding protein